MEEPYSNKQHVGRAERLELRLPLRYRLRGQDDWSSGETVNVSETGLLFSSDHALEVDTRLEITFQTDGDLLLRSSKRDAHVVRRVLNNWPETRPMAGARFYT